MIINNLDLWFRIAARVVEGEIDYFTYQAKSRLAIEAMVSIHSLYEGEK